MRLRSSTLWFVSLFGLSLFGVGLFGTSLGAPVASAGPEDQPPQEGGGCSWDGSSAPVRVGWGTPTRTRSCFFFSGPGDLGRDDQLGARATWSRQGARVQLRFSGDVVFSGRVTGSSVELTRVSTHSYGSGWTVTETITGQLRERDGCVTLAARYHYDECDGEPGCTPGQCHIDVPLVISGR